MSNRTLLYVFIVWCILTLIEYFLLPYFTLFWLGLSFVLAIVTIAYIIHLLTEIKLISKRRVLRVLMLIVMLYINYQGWIVHGYIEKLDWKIFYNKRISVIKQVEENKLSINNRGVAKLPFSFPILSNGGNEIEIFQNKQTKTFTVTFWVYRNYFWRPSTCFIYTNDKEEVKELEEQIRDDPKNNWKIQDNWYRTLGFGDG
ncbi:MAG TPA: hypothetical protein VHB70_02315 [Parafilimonas sp.]|nr:hypothetical protein [Parafilimonas sp.]